ncbi:MAG: hypothetical protein QM808_06265 [Steroidobacteraceae bacterium]
MRRVFLNQFACSLAALGFAMSVHANEMLDDLTGRIEYAFYAGDARTLQQSVQALEKLQVDASERDLYGSYLNYGRWKLAQLLATTDPNQAQQSAQLCADGYSSVSSAATQQALAAACLNVLETLRPLRGVLYRRERDAAITHAVQTGSKTLEVQFVAAWLATKNARQDASAGYTAIKQVVAQYSAASASWGHAEACYLLGQAELVRGDKLAARNALEQALVLAPDYRDARQLLQSLSLK